MRKILGDIGFGIITGIIYLIALLPLKMLYILADFLYFLLYYVIKYRKKLVKKNLSLCFPNYTPQQLKQVEKQFYHNFADYIIETIKLLHISDKQMQCRMTFENLDIIHNLLDDGKSVIAYFAHTGNWEWAPSITLNCRHQVNRGDIFAQIYRPLRDHRFNRLMLKIRSRFGSVSIAKKVALRTLMAASRDDIVSITGFMSDQKPSHGDSVHIINFLGRPTPVITGTETLGRRLGMAAVYWDMSKPGRGHYKITVKLLTEDMSLTKPMEVTDKYFKMLEETIQHNPAIWLWSHNRWKNVL